ncbi:carboxymuconolactone decarboxylase family protein [Paenarthrobacter sp. DKR-5]|uniref:carboxymuconolactone decarboxylase family protein n=1 Tax=Paenarthrobacter sp. DKR-5 TaxID=2835535 RepID=UPI001BDD877E|nr:carboxymuconolactone decarboxylase family protein [Paenarthrobacter sp. DKR-5]MBT1003214.1 carboxymuconolactone decarboxylase family protein [Paenarthrobacter sp. DKR-5]
MGDAFYLDKSNPDIWKGLNAVALKVRAAAEDAGISRAVLELLNVRISQINGCAYCLDLHSRLAADAGVPARKLHVLAAWREAGVYSDLELSALTVAEAVTLMGEEERRSALQEARAQLTDEQYAALNWAAVTINSFNRISIISGYPIKPLP